MDNKELRCQICGAPINERVRFCPKCGVKIIIPNDTENNSDIVQKVAVTETSIKQKESKAVKNKKRLSMKVIVKTALCLVLVCVGFGAGFFVGREYKGWFGEKETVKKVRMDKGSISYEYENYKEVEAIFRAKGFENIQTIDIDLRDEHISRKDEVSSISIGGDDSFSIGKRFSINEKVIITHY